MFEELINKINQCKLILIIYTHIDYKELTHHIENYNESKNAIWLLNDDDCMLEHIDKIDFKNNGFIACKGDNYYYFKMEDVVEICGKYTTDDGFYDIIFENKSYNEFNKEILHLVNREENNREEDKFYL